MVTSLAIEVLSFVRSLTLELLYLCYVIIHSLRHDGIS